jgi:hypothetical protein
MLSAAIPKTIKIETQFKSLKKVILKTPSIIIYVVVKLKTISMIEMRPRKKLCKWYTK